MHLIAAAAEAKAMIVAHRPALERARRRRRRGTRRRPPACRSPRPSAPASGGCRRPRSTSSHRRRPSPRRSRMARRQPPGRPARRLAAGHQRRRRLPTRPHGVASGSQPLEHVARPPYRHRGSPECRPPSPRQRQRRRTGPAHVGHHRRECHRAPAPPRAPPSASDRIAARSSARRCDP